MPIDAQKQSCFNDNGLVKIIQTINECRKVCHLLHMVMQKLMNSFGEINKHSYSDKEFFKATKPLPTVNTVLRYIIRNNITINEHLLIIFIIFLNS